MNNINDIRNSVLAELAAAEERMNTAEDKLNQDPNNWEVQGEFESAQEVCWALQGDLDNWCC